MSKISKFINLDKNILLEYIYNDGNLITEAYDVLINSKDTTRSYLATNTSGTNNTQGNSLFRIDAITGRFGKINPAGYNFLQLKNFSAPSPVRHDILKIHTPINWTFGEYLGLYVRVYAFDTTNRVRFDLSNFYFDMTDVSQSYLLNYSAPPLLFREKLWGKYLQIEIPSLNQLALQLTNNLPTPNSINANITGGVGLNMFSPVFIDFQFIKSIQTVNAVTTYVLESPISTTIPQTPEFENLGLKIEASPNGDFFEIFGTYADTIAGFKKFIDDSVLIGSRYYVQYDITLYEQNIRGKTLTITVSDSFNEKIEYRPIIKFTTTTAIIDVEMRLIDAVDESSIIRRASYGMLQDQVSKYSVNLTKINLSGASKPKIYNMKNSVSPSLVGIANSMGMLSVSNVGKRIRSLPTAPVTVIQTVQVPFPVLIDRYNIMAKSENATLDSKTFFGYGKLQILLYPFDNIMRFVIASGTEQAPTYFDLSRFLEIKLIFRTDQTEQAFPIFQEAADDLVGGNLTFKIPQAKYTEIKKIFDQNVNVFYITGFSQNISSVIYTGLFKVFDSTAAVAELNQQAPTPGITLDTSVPAEVAIITKKPFSIRPLKKPSTMKNNALVVAIKDQIKEKSNQASTATSNFTKPTPQVTPEFTVYINKFRKSVKEVAKITTMPLDEFLKLNGLAANSFIQANTEVKVPRGLKFKSPFLIPKK